MAYLRLIDGTKGHKLATGCEIKLHRKVGCVLVVHHAAEAKKLWACGVFRAVKAHWI